MKLLFVRHGESTANLLHQFSNQALDHPLTERGVAQAHALAQRLSGIQVEKVYTSPVKRAVQTAEIVANSLSAPLEVTDALREWDVGIYEGTTDPVGWDLHRQVQEDWFLHGRLESKMPGGESFLEIRARFIPFIARLVAEGSAADRTLVLVGHGGLFLAMLPQVLVNVDQAFAISRGFPYATPVTAVTPACWAGVTTPGGLVCTAWGEEHLD